MGFFIFLNDLNTSTSAGILPIGIIGTENALPDGLIVEVGEDIETFML